MKITNHNNLPNAIKRAVENDPYDSSGSDISTTRLIAPPRIRILEKRNWDLLEEDVADRIWSLLGQSVHHIIERSARKGETVEKRLFYKDDGITNSWTLSGQFDYLDKDGKLMDFKVTSAWSALDAMAKGKDEWEQQLNVLDFLCKKNKEKEELIDVKSLSIVAILRDWSINKAERDDNYPKQQAMIIPIRKWTDQEQEDFIRERIKLHQESETLDKLPLCTPKERWRKEDVFAVMKDGRKSALRLLPNKEQAQQYLKDHNMVENKGCSIVHRLGQDVRCANYCKVNSFCSYYMGVSDN
jgi:hypothetical protein